MKKIIILTFAFVAIALLPQTLSAQIEVAPEPAKKMKAEKETVKKVEKVVYKKAADQKTQKVTEVKAQKATKPVVAKDAVELKKAQQKPASTNKPIEMIVKRIKGPDKKITKKGSTKKNPKQ